MMPTLTQEYVQNHTREFSVGTTCGHRADSEIYRHFTNRQVGRWVEYLFSLSVASPRNQIDRLNSVDYQSMPESTEIRLKIDRIFRSNEKWVDFQSHSELYRLIFNGIFESNSSLIEILYASPISTENHGRSSVVCKTFVVSFFTDQISTHFCGRFLVVKFRKM